jgi:CheY-like chemotaxis protein
VLVAEDDVEMRSVLALSLRKVGYQVIAVGDGAAALQALGPLANRRSTEPRPGLVVTDVRLPLFSGLQVLEAARILDRWLPVIVITAFGDPVTREGARSLAASAILDKPFEMEELVKVARRCAPPGFP